MSARNIISDRSHRSCWRVAVGVVIPVMLVTASGGLARAQVVDDFKDRDTVREWKVVSDAPLASGQVSSANGVRDGGLRLDFDLKCEGGRKRCDERSIGVTKKLTPAATGEVLSLWVRCTACEIGLAVTDASGQRLSYTPASLPLSARSLDAWRRVIVSLPRDVASHDGGANDGKLHPGIEEIRVEAKKDRLLGSKGYLEVDEIGLYSSMAEATGGHRRSVDRRQGWRLPAGCGLASWIPFGAPGRALECGRKNARRVRLRVSRRGRSQA
jgi:hypothetical protein